MTSPEAEATATNSLTIATWNILLDNTRTNAGIIRSQADRLPSQIKTLEALRERLGSQLDAVAIQEAHKTDFQHNGECLAQALGYGIGQWIEHNQKPFPTSKTGRKGEYVGLLGARIDHAEPIELGDNRKAILSHIGRTAIVNIHPRAGLTNEHLQLAQVQAALEHIEDNQHAAFVGDLNSRLGGKARKAIEARGFESVFPALGKRHPKTWPTSAYRGIMYGRAHYFIPSVTLDDIYVRGLEVLDAGTFIGDSDHAGLYATVSTQLD